MGAGTTEGSMPEWLEEKLQKSVYMRTANRYYGSHDPSNPLYIEVGIDGTIRAYDGLEFKRGLRLGECKDGLDFATVRIEIAEFMRTRVDIDKWRAALASAVSFARRAREQYDWNIIPVFEGYEVRTSKP